jgi:asparagine synthase (glutamine-hydrolysing)
MCGIAGILQPAGLPSTAEDQLRRMMSSIRYRGPDQFGLFRDEQAALGSVRLSIIDLSTGQQPLANEDETLWIVFNGEIFNHVELRPQLEERGHRFKTHSDTEVILHLYEELGAECLSRLNGQFAFAIWDRRRRTLFLARDRLGVRPLFYARHNGTLYFGSEIKAIFNGSPLSAQIEPSVLREVFTYWSPLPGHTVFRDVVELPPGHYLVAHDNSVTVRRYWQLSFEPAYADGESPPADLPERLEEFEALLVDATRLRLRADVPVGAYLSGGLDSSTITAVIRNYTSNRLRTFSIAFTDANFDEREHQRRMAEFLGTEHQIVEATHADIGRVFPDVIWHTEVPVLRTAPAPMLLLSKLVHDSGFKVVLTGEGADEFLGGYDIFKEATVRRFWARQPDSRLRPLLLQRLYPEIVQAAQPSRSFLAAFFREGLMDYDAPDYSHALRWRTTQRAWRFLSDDAAGTGAEFSRGPIAELLPTGFKHWGTLERAQFLEATIFLSQYLLCSQGDRVTMANSVEGRFPFLDHRVVEFCNHLPSRLKLRGLNEKYLLRILARRWLPPEIWKRRKRPYRAPIHRSFFHKQTPDYVRELLSDEALLQSGCFNPLPVRQLVAKLDQGKALGETDDMALAGILSTQLVHHQFVQNFKKAVPIDDGADGKVVRCPNLATAPST